MRKLTAILILLCLCVSAYAVKLIPNGSTSQSITVVIVDANGDPNTSATITDLDFYVQLDGAFGQSAKVDLTALGSATTAWDDYKAYHMGNGIFRIDIPDANLSDGAGSLLTYIIADGATSNRTSYYEVQLETTTIASIAVDANNVAEDANDLHGWWIDGGRLDLIQDAIAVDANNATDDANDLHSWWANGGRLDLILDTTVSATTTAQMRTNVWTAAAGSYDVEDSFGNIVNDMVAEYATDGVYYLAALDEDSTAIDLNSTTVIATLSSASVDLIWDELLSGHTTVGSASEALTIAARKRGY